MGCFPREGGREGGRQARLPVAATLVSAPAQAHDCARARSRLRARARLWRQTAFGLRSASSPRNNSSKDRAWRSDSGPKLRSAGIYGAPLAPDGRADCANGGARSTCARLVDSSDACLLGHCSVLHLRYPPSHRRYRHGRTVIWRQLPAVRVGDIKPVQPEPYSCCPSQSNPCPSQSYPSQSRRQLPGLITDMGKNPSPPLLVKIHRRRS